MGFTFPQPMHSRTAFTRNAPEKQKYYKTNIISMILMVVEGLVWYHFGTIFAPIRFQFRFEIVECFKRGSAGTKKRLFFLMKTTIVLLHTSSLCSHRPLTVSHPSSTPFFMIYTHTAKLKMLAYHTSISCISENRARRGVQRRE